MLLSENGSEKTFDLDRQTDNIRDKMTNFKLGNKNG